MINKERGVAVVGAGIVGLSVGWFLQEHGLAVTIFERHDSGAGASSGNAGWLCPALTVPLPEPSVLASGIRSLVRRDSPLRIPARSLLGTAPFLFSFAMHCTTRRWSNGALAYNAISALAQSAYDRMSDEGVAAPLFDAPIVAAFAESREAAEFRHELEMLTLAGFPTEVTELAGDQLLSEEPLLSARALYGFRIERQRFLDPKEFVQSLADSFRGRGGHIETEAPVGGIRSDHSYVFVRTPGTEHVFGAVVLANGAWLRELAGGLGVKVRMAAGRGYSFTAETRQQMRHPLYLPARRVACTPTRAGMRVAGLMEFASPDAPIDPDRVEAIKRSASAMLSAEVRLDRVSDLWVGPRPVTADGLPIIGLTRREHVFTAGGHGMWGMTLGPVTGQLLAELIATGTSPTALIPFRPTR
jgi:D-amino-acid dehydrogenase